MVAKIGKGQSLYGALAYNHNKLAGHTARIISGNRMITDVANIPENAMRNMMLSFENYLQANRNTKNPILHISLNPSPEDRLTDGQFAALAADYMEKMGYGDQPYVVFMHEDTGRRHIHIVTTCVDENGRKIDDAYEWRRSMQACRELEQKYGLKNVADKKNELAAPYLKKVDRDLKRQVSNTLKSVLSTCRFQTFGEYSALLACYNIEAKQVRGEHDGQPYTGIVYTATDERGKAVGPPFKSSLFGKQFGYAGLIGKMNRHAADYRNRKWEPKIQDTVRLAMTTCRGDRMGFERVMHGKGIDVHFRLSDEGRIYGVTFIDHNAREVYNGSRLGKEFSANSFEKLFRDPAPSQDNRQSQDAGDGLAELFGVDISGFTEPEPYDDLIRQKKRKKKKKRSII